MGDGPACDQRFGPEVLFVPLAFFASWRENVSYFSIDSPDEPIRKNHRSLAWASGRISRVEYLRSRQDAKNAEE